MKVSLIAVGRPRGLLAQSIADYEARVARYYRFESAEVRETPFRGQPTAQVVSDEGDRLLARIPDQNQLVALHHPGTLWTSEQLAHFLSEASVSGIFGVTFVIGGAYGLSPAVLSRADRLLSLSAMTLPHEMARLVLAEQLYRAGTISRGEPYHKGGTP